MMSGGAPLPDHDRRNPHKKRIGPVASCGSSASKPDQPAGSMAPARASALMGLIRTERSPDCRTIAPSNSSPRTSSVNANLMEPIDSRARSN